MPTERLLATLAAQVAELESRGTAKGVESVVTGVVPAAAGRGPRFLLDGSGQRAYLRMNSNSYLGMSLQGELIQAEEEAARRYGTGPGAVRFISGTYAPHVALERRLAAFHGREDALLFSSAYAAVLSAIVPLTTERTAVISDALNHNCIINAIRLSRPLSKTVYAHLDLGELEHALEQAARQGAARALVITDGVFSMRGDHAPLAGIMDLAARYDDSFAENAVVVVDDSHGVGAFGATGRGTEEYTGAASCDVLVATLGKALGVNGGYVAGAGALTRFLRETSPMYIYSNPITPAEAAAALCAVEILDSGRGRALMDRLRTLTARLETGLVRLGFDVIAGAHPVVPLLVRDTGRTRALVSHLRDRGILATGLTYPVVPRGDEEIRFQVNADHTEADIDEVLATLSDYADRP